MNLCSSRPASFGKRRLVLGLIAGLALAASAETCHAGFVVAKGFDLFETLPGTNMFGGQPYQGVAPYGFNFGGKAGYKLIGQAKTSMIVQRLGKAQLPGPGTATVNVKLAYFTLRSANKYNHGGFGNAYYYVSLQSNNASTGTYTIHFNGDGSGGTFDASITLNYVVRKGKTGRVVARSSTTLTATNVAWTRNLGPVAARVRYANYLLSGYNTSQDFLPVGPFNWTTTGGDTIFSKLASPFGI